MSDLRHLSKQDLEDIERSTDLAARHINIMSAAASRFINLGKRASTELQRRVINNED